MGSGNDEALISVYSYFDVDGDRILEDRQVIVDGGIGYDRAILSDVVIQNGVHSPANGVIDLRLAATRTLTLNTFQITGFEEFRASFQIMSSCTIISGSGHDVIQIDGTSSGYYDPSGPAAYQNVVVRGGAGHDIVIGSPTDTAERLLGEDGHDFIVLSGRSPWVDAFDFGYGGNGNDILSVDGITATGKFGQLFGGAGYDTFVITPTSGGNRIIRDFVQGEDRIVFDGMAWWHRADSFDRLALHEHVHRVTNATTITNTADELQFWFAAPDIYGVFRDYFILYDRDTGKISYDFRMSDQTWSNHREWAFLGSVTGAPDLTLADFGFLLP